MDDGSDSFSAEAERLARNVLSAGDPYDAAFSFMGFAMLTFGSDQSVDDWAAGLYLIWGSLTDGIDGPQRDPAATAAWATEAMRRAAREWLAVSHADLTARTEYLDRWVYEECGYARSDSG